MYVVTCLLQVTVKWGYLFGDLRPLATGHLVKIAALGLSTYRLLYGL